MGGPERNKLLVPIDGVPLVRRVAGRIADAGFAEVVAVLGFEAERVAAALAGLAIRTVVNPEHEVGQMTSVRAGLAALGAPSAGVMICLGDMPALTTADYRAIAAGFFARARGTVLVPTYRGARGNPIVLDRPALADILARDARFGCRQYVARNADIVATLELGFDAILRDVDHPEDANK